MVGKGNTKEMEMEMEIEKSQALAENIIQL
jgi:hypothetical protein